MVLISMRLMPAMGRQFRWEPRKDNYGCTTTTVVSPLGAPINFQAGTVKRENRICGVWVRPLGAAAVPFHPHSAACQRQPVEPVQITAVSESLADQNRAKSRF